VDAPTWLASKEGVRPIQGELFSESDPAAKAGAIVRRLQQGLMSSEEVFAAFAELDALPPEVAKAALAEAVGPAPDPAALDPEIRRAHGLPPPPLELVERRVVRDADVLELDALAHEQLRAAGKAWDGLDLEPEERLDGEREDTFAGTLVVRTFADAKSNTPLFDVFTYGADSGTVFRAGTTDVVGAIAYGTVEMGDRRARTALQRAISAAPSEAVTLATTPPPAEAAKTRRGAAAATKKKAASADAPAKKKAASADAPAKKKKAASVDAPAKKKAASADASAKKKKAASVDAPAKKKVASADPPAKKKAASADASAKKKAASTDAPTTKKKKKAASADAPVSKKKAASADAPAAKKKATSADAPAKKRTPAVKKKAASAAKTGAAKTKAAPAKKVGAAKKRSTS